MTKIRFCCSEEDRRIVATPYAQHPGKCLNLDWVNREALARCVERVAHFRLAFDTLVDLEEDRYEEAIRELQEMIRQDPGTAPGYLELGRALVHQRRYEEAIPVLRTSAQKTPDSGMAHYELALALIKTGQWEDALPEMKAAVLCTPGSAQMHFYLAAVNLRLKRFPEATAEFDKTLELDANHFLASLKYGEMLLLEGDAAGALSKLNQAVKVDPKSAEAHGALANTYQALGQNENAARERALAAQFQRQAPE